MISVISSLPVLALATLASFMIFRQAKQPLIEDSSLFILPGKWTLSSKLPCCPPVSLTQDHFREDFHDVPFNIEMDSFPIAPNLGSCFIFLHGTCKCLTYYICHLF